MIQNFNRWLLSTFSAEAVVEGETFDIRPREMGSFSLGDPPSIIDQVVGIDTRTTNTCQSCGFVTSRDATIHAVDLAYPRKAADAPNFAELLRASIIRESSTRATCSNCRQFAPLESKRVLAAGPHSSLPPVLSVNAMVASPEVFGVWRDRGKAETEYFLPKEVTFRSLPGGDLVIAEGKDGIRYEVRVSRRLGISLTFASPSLCKFRSLRNIRPIS